VSKSKSVPRPATPSAAPSRVTAAADAERRAARLAQKEQARIVAARRQRRARLRTGALIAAVPLVLGGLLAWLLVREMGKPGEATGQQPSPHIAALTTAHASYNTDPPTSGPHVSQVPPWGAATTPVPKELQVHALEDAGVIISYNPTLAPATLAQLQTLVGSYAKEVILTPAPGLSAPIITTAWGRLQRFPQYDEPALRRFIDAYRGIDHHQDSGS